jgi:hypothetical protein
LLKAFHVFYPLDINQTWRCSTAAACVGHKSCLIADGITDKARAMPVPRNDDQTALPILNVLAVLFVQHFGECRANRQMQALVKFAIHGIWQAFRMAIHFKELGLFTPAI